MNPKTPLPDAVGFEFDPPEPPGLCFCGDIGTRKFKGYWLCDLCGPIVERRWRIAHPFMATRIKAKP